MSLTPPIAVHEETKASPILGECSDADVISAVLGGDRSKFEIIVRRYNLQLYRVGMAYLHSHVQAEDAMQNTYLKAFVGLGNFEGTAAFATWLTRIMVNECLMIIRSQKKILTEPFEPDQLETGLQWVDSAARDQISNKEIKTLLEQGINLLPDTYRSVYVMREIQQLSTIDTAACLGISEANVKVLLHRARAELKTHLLESAAGSELFKYPAIYCNAITAQVMHQISSLSDA